MKGLLIYDNIGAKRNEWFINSLISNFKSKNIDLELTIIDDEDINKIKNINFAIVRTIAPKINSILENTGIRVFNNFNTSLIANDKWKTYLFCKSLHVPTMPTYQDISSVDLHKFPYIIKSCNGHGGTEVFWIDNLDKLIAIKDYFHSLDKKFIIQKPCSELGKDMRIYVMGNEIISSVLRYNSNSFKSNYSLGGKVQKANPTIYQIDIVKKIISHLKSDYIGIDFIFDNGKWVLNEIEDVVGARMLYEVTHIDIASKYCSYIKSKLIMEN